MVNIDKVKAIAKLRGLKLSRLCADFGEDPTYFDKVKKGARRMDDSRIAFLAEKLGTTFAYLTDVSDDPNPKSKLPFPMFHYKRYDERRIARGLTVNYVEDHPHGYMDSFNELSEGEVYKLAVLLNTTYEYLMGMTDDPRIPADDRTDPFMPVGCDQCGSTPNYTHPIPQPYPLTQQSGAALIGSLRSFFVSAPFLQLPPGLPRQFQLSHPPKDAHSKRGIHSTRNIHST